MPADFHIIKGGGLLCVFKQVGGGLMNRDGSRAVFIGGLPRVEAEGVEFVFIGHAVGLAGICELSIVNCEL